MSLCVHLLRGELDGFGAVSGAVEVEWSQQTRTAKLNWVNDPRHDLFQHVKKNAAANNCGEACRAMRDA